MGKVSGFFSIRVFVDVSFVLLSMSKRAGNKLEKLLGWNRQPSEFCEIFHGGAIESLKERWIPKNLLGRKILLETCDIIPKGEKCEVSVRAFFVCFFRDPIPGRPEVEGYPKDQGWWIWNPSPSWWILSVWVLWTILWPRPWKEFFFWIESVTRGRVQRDGYFFWIKSSANGELKVDKILMNKFSAPKSCWLEKWIPGGRWSIFDPTWSTRVPRPWGVLFGLFFSVDTMLQAVVFVVCWQFFA